jgi:hypothetical protein
VRLGAAGAADSCVVPVECDTVLIEGCVVSGSKDAGLYVGQSRNIVVRNRVIANNVPTFADKDAFVKYLLQGTGILALAADGSQVAGNEVTDNGSFAIGVSSRNAVFPPNTRFDVDPNPAGTWVHDNVLQGNLRAPDARLQTYVVPSRDLNWDLSGKGSVWEQRGATTFPNRLPAKK